MRRRLGIHQIFHGNVNPYETTAAASEVSRRSSQSKLLLMGAWLQVFSVILVSFVVGEGLLRYIGVLWALASWGLVSSIIGGLTTRLIVLGANLAAGYGVVYCNLIGTPTRLSNILAGVCICIVVCTIVLSNTQKQQSTRWKRVLATLAAVYLSAIAVFAIFVAWTFWPQQKFATDLHLWFLPFCAAAISWAALPIKTFQLVAAGVCFCTVEIHLLLLTEEFITYDADLLFGYRCVILVACVIAACLEYVVLRSISTGDAATG